MLRLDDREAEAQVANAEAGSREAREKVAQTNRTKESLEEVWRVGGTSLQTVKDAESDYQIAVAAREKADAQLRSATLLRDKMKVIAPFTGLITKDTAHVGEWVVPGTPIITLADEKTREIEAVVDDADAGLIAVGESVEISSDAFPGRLWVERVVRLDPAVQKEGTANTITVHISLASNARELRYGQQVDAKIRTAYREKARKVPFEALINKDGKMFVAVMNAGRVQMTPVVSGIENATHVEIREGIQPGQEVILPDGKRLKDGQRVHQVQDAGAL